MPGYSISIFLPDGTPTGLRLARRSHWTGEVLMCPRTLYPSISDRAQFRRTGVYILVGTAEDGTGGPRVYVGEGDNVGERIKAHLSAKSFWEDLVVVSKTDGSLHKADVRYLEAQLVELAAQSPVVSLDNVKTPGPPAPTEAHKADLDVFLTDTLAILRLLGVDAFTSTSPSPSPPVLPGEQPTTSTATPAGDYYFAMGQATGTMTVTGDGFVLRAGTGIARHDKMSIGGGYKLLRARLFEKGTLALVPDDPDHLRLTEDVQVSSPSAAGAVVYGGNVNGRTQWKDDRGRSLAEREAMAAEVPS